MRFFFLIGAVIWHVTSSEAGTVEVNKDELRAAAASLDIFEPALSQYVMEETKGNLVYSSPAAWLVLSMAAYGLPTASIRQMQDIYGLRSSHSLTSFEYIALVNYLQNYRTDNLHAAVGLFYDHKAVPGIRTCERIKSTFYNEVKTVDFSNPKNATETINEWFDVQTSHHIKDLIKPTDINSITKTVPASAIYFKGTWKTPFKTIDTVPLPFHVNSTKLVNVTCMCGWGSYKYGYLKDVDAEFFEIPCKRKGPNPALSMFIVLPRTVGGLPELERNIHELTMDRFVGGRKKSGLCLPKFKIESEIDLNSVLTKMSLAKMFTGRRAFSDSVQKAIIEVDEGNDGEAEVTYNITGSSPNLKIYTVYHSFIGFIATQDKVPIKLLNFRYTGLTDP